jgi:pilus assembly protein CpaB
MLALGCGLVAAIGFIQLRRNAEPSPIKGETQNVFVANANVGMGDLLTSEKLKADEWPKEKVPEGALTRLADIEGRRVRTRLFAGDLIIESKLMGKGASQQGATGLIPKGYRVVPIRVDADNSSNLIMPGDRVDVMLHVTRDLGRQIPETVTRTILQDIKVFAVDAVLDLESEKEPGRSINAKTISLLVSPSQAAKLMLAGQLGKCMLVMRSPEDDVLAENAQASPSELFGDNKTSKANRSKETLMEEEAATAPKPVKKPSLLSLLATTQAKTPTTAATKKTWTMRILVPGTVNDVVLESDQPATAKDPNSGRWRTASATATPVGGSAPQAQPATPSPPSPSTGAAEDSGDKKSEKVVKPLAEDSLARGQDASVGASATPASEGDAESNTKE